MSGGRPHRIWRLLAVAAVAVALSACGKKADLVPPDGEEASYTYPRAYPNPDSVLPSTDKKSEPPARPAPPFAGGLSPFPKNRTTTTYQSAPPQ